MAQALESLVLQRLVGGMRWPRGGAASGCSPNGCFRHWRIEAGEEGAADPLEFLVGVDACEPAAAPGQGQLLAEQGQGRCRAEDSAGSAGRGLLVFGSKHPVPEAP